MFSIFVPPLRERKPDVLLLADYFLEKFSREHGKSVKRISTPAIDMLTQLSLAGQRARAGQRRSSGRSSSATRRSCTRTICRRRCRPPKRPAPVQTSTLRDSMEAFEKDALQDALKSARGNRAKAARLLARPSGSSTTGCANTASTGEGRISEAGLEPGDVANSQTGFNVGSPRIRSGRSKQSPAAIAASWYIPRMRVTVATRLMATM